MEPKTKTQRSSVWLSGNPIFSLAYGSVERPMYVDLTGFRPDPVDYLLPGKIYPASITFDMERDYKGVDRWVFRSVYIDSLTGSHNKFVYIR